MHARLLGLGVVVVVAACSGPRPTEDESASAEPVAGCTAPVFKVKTYVAGEVVQSKGQLYECKPFPYDGWCGVGGPYEPGVGASWSDAWISLGACGSQGSADAGTSVDAGDPPDSSSPSPPAGPPPAGIVYFSNTGTTVGWSSATPQSHTIGKVVDVTTPVFKSHTAILTEQTYVKPQGAHSEVMLAEAQRNGEDRYYGQAIYLPVDWNTIDKNATFQQFSPESPAGPWNLNWVQNDHIFIRVAGTHYDCGAITKGEWTRVVVRFKTTNPGIFEYWVNGKKTVSVTNVDLTIPNGSPSMRWSTGIYVTWWRTQPPGPQLTRQIYHDQLRVASTYALAEPANW
jgi:hypothetical protein